MMAQNVPTELVDQTFRIAIGHYKEGKYEEAVERLYRLIRNDEKNYRLYIDLADCYLKMNQKQKAIDALESFQKLGIRSTAISEMLSKIQTNSAVF